LQTVQSLIFMILTYLINCIWLPRVTAYSAICCGRYKYLCIFSLLSCLNNNLTAKIVKADDKPTTNFADKADQPDLFRGPPKTNSEFIDTYNDVRSHSQLQFITRCLVYDYIYFLIIAETKLLQDLKAIRQMECESLILKNQ
jgi:hypothetical protein